MARIVSLGRVLQDIILIDRDDFASVEIAGQSIFSELTIGSKIDIDHLRYSVGGGALNSATTFARCGHESVLFGTIAHDSAGEAILAALDRESIDSSYLATERGTTGCSIILLDAKTGERTILTHRGVSGQFRRFSASDLDLVAPDWLYATTTGGDMDKLLAFFEHAHELGIKIMFNPGAAEISHLPKLHGLLELVDILLVNKTEAAQIVPGVVLSELIEHLAYYCPTVLITDGVMGAIATDGKATWRLGVYEQVRMRDATGAGDAFGSGFLAKLADGAEFVDALQFASANAASVVQKYGASTGILTGSEDLHPMPIQQLT